MKILLTGVSALFGAVGVHLGTPGWVLALAAAVVGGALVTERRLRSATVRVADDREALRPTKRHLQAVEAA